MIIQNLHTYVALQQFHAVSIIYVYCGQFWTQSAISDNAVYIHCVAWNCWNCTTGTIVNIGQNLSKEELGTVEERGFGREGEEEDIWEGYLIFLSKKI